LGGKKTRGPPLVFEIVYNLAEKIGEGARVRGKSGRNHSVGGKKESARLLSNISLGLGTFRRSRVGGKKNRQQQLGERQFGQVEGRSGHYQLEPRVTLDFQLKDNKLNR